MSRPKLTDAQRLRALLLDARWCLADDVRAAGEAQAQRQPGMRHRAQLLARIDRELSRTRGLAYLGRQLRRPV